MFSKALADAKKELPMFLVISYVVWAIDTVTDYQGFYPITWLILIVLTALTLCALHAMFIVTLDLIYRLIKGILHRDHKFD